MPLKDEIFDIGSAALKAAGADRELYACPICLRGYTRSDLDQLTVEHVPQRSIGGKRLVLTCKSCNNTAGHRFEADLANAKGVQTFYDTIIGSKTGNIGVVDIGFGEQRISADLTRSTEGLDFQILAAHNSPDTHTAFEKYLRAEGQKQDFSITSRHRFRPKLVDLAYLKSAYLWMFAKAGYWFVAHPALSLVRNALRSGEAYVLFRQFKVPELKHGWGCLGGDNDFFLVCVKGRSVLLPAPKSDVSKHDAIARGAPIVNQPGRYFRMPEKLVAEVDFAGSHRITINETNV